ncbi:aminoacyl-tRNA hydrolase [bacterium]|nr:MAG: aminoacyl-tRNA hydrolase [bacterium]
MKIIVGLGNPGKQYQLTRHNAGFLAVDYFLKNHEAISCQSKFNAQVCEYHENGVKVFIVKPQSFMNLSGEVVKEIAHFYKIDIANDLLVVHDDKDLDFEKIKFTDGSGSAGQNGVQNIIDELGTKSFHRIRIGVESREAGSPIETADFVLQKFTDEEMKVLEEKVLPGAARLIENFIAS